ncbi:putative para-hydroxybenzoate-polyprenyltransferase Coq2 [Aspergillus clavatus NRRL 1]|uniref:4-hydroxybenzoate polyprenyltransferase, mitochondrial n=1 Tax=Aspergillus clavatus (strain ATCC 1007 / CBS 513.65 / DSM 816 / NCTC 3887 / NRRL 1 / QM 1276 / 107) TaxID=344612 RepID=A1CGQ5_ASPCL|nr:para-hydroxybenzoate-polyprenyltransferase Coq2, putative [Aspergillus clavatus NRRL 1]EAW10060.1 para-hydroxybenzoate-polyprenyltransferase Coq2, putative [Aspergillus clavatus NRRL 1]
MRLPSSCSHFLHHSRVYRCSGSQGNLSFASLCLRRPADPSLCHSMRAKSTVCISAYPIRSWLAIQTKAPPLFRRNSHSLIPPSSTACTSLAADNEAATRYTPPQRGFIASLPRTWIPYAELVRLDKPSGTYYLFFPCLFSTLLAAPMASCATPLHVLSTAGLFFVGAFIMRGAGCAINDLWDRNLDPNVQRTKFRPIARGALSPQKALVFTGSQLLAGLGVLLQFPSQCLWYGIPSLVLVTAYPLAKRVTYYPQAVLGLTFSWGAIMGFPALGVDLLSDPTALGAAAALYSSCVAWTVLYDMIYAHMDIKDDVAAGIKSIALRHEKNTKKVLSGLAVVQVALLATAGVASGAGPVFFVGSCGSAALSLGVMIWKVQLENVKDCWWWFKNGCLLTGGGITLGMFLEYMAHISGLYDKPDSEIL